MLVGAPADQGRAGRSTSRAGRRPRSTGRPKATVQAKSERTLAESSEIRAPVGPTNWNKKSKSSWKPFRTGRPGGTQPQTPRHGGSHSTHLAPGGTDRTAKGPKARAKKHRGKAPVKLIFLTREVRLAPTREVGLRWFLTREVRLADWGRCSCPIPRVHTIPLGAVYLPKRGPAENWAAFRPSPRRGKIWRF